MRSILMSLVLAACSPQIHPVGDFDLGCTTDPRPRDLAVPTCTACTPVWCRGREQPPCSICGDTACVPVKVDAGVQWCCYVEPTEVLPLCRLGVAGGPAY